MSEAPRESGFVWVEAQGLESLRTRCVFSRLVPYLVPSPIDRVSSVPANTMRAIFSEAQSLPDLAGS